jgi:hypothetical protein
MSMRTTIQWLSVFVLLAGGVAQAQQTPQVYDNNYALGNAPYSNPAPSAHHTILPDNEVGFVQNAQPFAPAEVSDYCLGQPAHDGYFFNYERLVWSFERPSQTTIGSRAAEGIYVENGTRVLETNSVQTNCFDARVGWGNRWEMGYVDKNNYGWLLGILDHVTQAQSVTTHGATMLFNDPNSYLFGLDFPVGFNQIVPGGIPEPGTDSNGDGIPDKDLTPHAIIPRFENLTVSNVITLNGVELMRSYRLNRLHNGGNLDVYFGARFLQVDDKFNVDSYNDRITGLVSVTLTNLTTGDVQTFATRQTGQALAAVITNTVNVANITTTPLPGTVPNFDTLYTPLDDIHIHTRVENNIVGPQFAARWSRQRGRWMHAFEARFMAGVNTQLIKQTVSIGDKYYDLGKDTTVFSTYQTINAYGQPVQVQVTAPRLGSFQGLNNFHPIGAANSKSTVVFAPLGELRLNSSYELTRNVALRFGYNFMAVNGINRGVGRTDYTLPNLGILPGGEHQSLIVHGLNFGVEYNR